MGAEASRESAEHTGAKPKGWVAGFDCRSVCSPCDHSFPRLTRAEQLRALHVSYGDVHSGGSRCFVPSAPAASALHRNPTGPGSGQTNASDRPCRHWSSVCREQKNNKDRGPENVERRACSRNGSVVALGRSTGTYTAVGGLGYLEHKAQK
jgi:hypothetical protein